MKFTAYIEEKIAFIMIQITFAFFLFLLFNIMGVPSSLILSILSISLFLSLGLLWMDFNIKRKQASEIIKLVDQIEEKYLISEVIERPKSIENKAYYYALKIATKAMNDKISKLEQEQIEYEEYIESFAHEIKTPIAALSLVFDNKNDYELKEEIKKIENLIEQMLYYARSENTEKDYFVKELNLEDVIHPVILNYKDHLLLNQITLNVHDLNEKIYTDEKWLTFILSQIIQNSIKYLDKKKKEIEIHSEKNANQIILVIKDNGCGIKKSDLNRVFEKGFTGTNRQKESATGIGLYLAKKLCDNLGLKIQIESQEQEYTKVTIVFPIGNVHKMS